MHVIAEVPTTAFDEDDGGKTLAEAGKEAFSLFAPAEASTAVTPLTTLVSVEMLSNPDSTPAEAQAVVKANNNIQGDMLGHDYVSKKDTNAHELAKKIVDAVVAAKKELDASAEFQSSAGAKPQLASMKAAVSQVQSSVISKMIAADGTVDTSFNAKEAAKNSISGNLQNIIVQTKSGDGTVVSMADILKEGLIIGEGEESQQIFDSQNTVRNQKDGLKVNYIKLSDDLKTFKVDKQYIYTTPLNTSTQIAVGSLGWYKAYDSGNDYFLVNGIWESYEEKIKAVEGNCILISQTANDGGLQKFCATRKDLAGKKVADFIEDVCKNRNDQEISGCNPNETFPDGAFGYDLQVTSQSDQYKVWVNPGSSGYFGDQNMDQFIASLTSAPICIGWCTVDIQIKSYDPVSKSGRLNWRKNATTAFTEETGFSVVDVNGVKVLRYENSKLYRDLEDEDRVWGIFAEVKIGNGTTKIERGEFTSKNMRQSIPFNGETKIGNTKVLDTFIKMKGMPAYPY